MAKTRTTRERAKRERPYKHLDIWQQSIVFVKIIYKISANFPDRERFGLIPQLRKAVVSIAVQIAKGSERSTKTRFKEDLNEAQAYLSEVETLLIISYELGYMPEKRFEVCVQKSNRVGIMLSGMIKKLNN